MSDSLFSRAARTLVLAAWTALATGCISIPDDVRADFEAPDGKRPNNFGRLVDTPQGPEVEPDTPTISAEEGS